jgi:hypothetical protein
LAYHRLKRDYDMAKRFKITKGKDGLLDIHDGSEKRQVTTYTQDGDEIRFSLAGQEGASYTVRRGDEDFDDLQKAFADNLEHARKDVERAEKASEPGAAKA